MVQRFFGHKKRVIMIFYGFLSFTFMLSMCSCQGSPRNFNVIFISMDTTRADYIDTGRGARAYTPEIRRFARRAVVFDRAYTTIPQTLPSHLSILSSHLPHELGVLSNEHQYDGRFKMVQEVFQERGFYTGAVISLGTLSSSTGFNKGFNDFFEDLFVDRIFFVPAEKVTARALQVLHELTEIQALNYFLFLHFSDPHSPYAPPGVECSFEIYLDGKLAAEFNAYHGAILRMEAALQRGRHTIDFKLAGPMADFRFFIIRRLEFGKDCTLSCKNLTFSEQHYGGAYLLEEPEGSIRVTCPTGGSMKLFQVIPILSPRAAVRYYQQEVEYMDRHIGRLLRHIEQSKLLERTIVVLFADHGEGLGERVDYYGHTRYLNQQFIRVPLVIHLPGVKPRQIKTPVSLAALSPTILDFLGMQDDQFRHWQSALKLIKSEKKYREYPIYSFTFAPFSIKDKFSVIKWPFQGIFYLDEDRLSEKEFYNLSISQSYNHKDAFFENVLKRNSLAYYNAFLKEFVHLKKAFNRSGQKRMLIDNQTLEKLNALGYIR